MREINADRIASRSLFIAEIDWRPVGAIVLMRDDPQIWGDVPGEAVYVHGLATRGTVQGQGVGAAMLDWAGDIAKRADRHWLRLDCTAENARLRAYYEGLGFAHRGDVRVGEPPRQRNAALYERLARIAKGRA